MCTKNIWILKISLSISTENPGGILIGIVLNVMINLEKINILILDLPINEYRVSVHLFKSFTISFISVL